MNEGMNDVWLVSVIGALLMGAFFAAGVAVGRWLKDRENKKSK